MTEQEWLASADPAAMLDFLNTPASLNGRPWREWRPSEWKLRLAEKTIWSLKFCHLAEEEADLKHLVICVKDRPNRNFIEPSIRILRDIIGNPFRPVTLPAGESVPCPRCGNQRDWHDALTGDGRCFDCQGQGGFYGPSPVLTPLVRSLAEAAYQERREDGTLDPDRLLVLSDALEEAGMPTDETCCRCGGTGSLGGGRKVPASRTKLCDACGGRLQLPHPLLDHLRGPGPHYRGCWAIDLLTGRG